jgi:hypothetical protein
VKNRVLPVALIVVFASLATVFVATRGEKEPRVTAVRLEPATPPVATTATPTPTLVSAPPDRAAYDLAKAKGVRGALVFSFEITAGGTVQNVTPLPTTAGIDREVVERFAADLAARRYVADPSRQDPLALTATFEVGG